ncbi:MAG: PD40 domain-containing protein, partial [Acidobacteria bacterium]|nr:PD40 domain-containing protein [Acidobacteriota bacterium]
MKPILTVIIGVFLFSAPLTAQGVYPNARSGGNYMHNDYVPPAGSSTPWWPSWSPDGQWIAFAMD